MLERMSPVSPTLEGFRAALRRPSLTLAEITWRWAVGASAIALFLFGLFEFLSTVPITNGELLLLRTRQPYLVALAIRHILRGSSERMVMSVFLALLLLAMLWVIAASLGRVATVNALLDYARQRLARATWAAGLAEDDGIGIARNAAAGNPVYALLRLNFLRAGLALAAVIGFAGAVILARLVSPDAHPRPGLQLLLFLFLASILWLAWSLLNWLLSLAAMFVVRDHEPAMGAISAAVALCHRRGAAVFAVSSWTSVAHLVLLVGASTLVSIPMGLLVFVSGRTVALVLMAGTLAYFAVADWLYMARLAGYIYVAETPDALLRAVHPGIVPPGEGPLLSSEPPVQTAIDAEELILSDVPGLLTET
jgi:hypothetical protein